MVATAKLIRGGSNNRRISKGKAKRLPLFSSGILVADMVGRAAAPESPEPMGERA